MTHHTRHLRGAIGSREHFDWAANGDSLRELEPVFAPTEQPQPIVGTGIGWVVPMAFVLAVGMTIVWANSGASAAPTTAFVASQSSQQAVSTKGFNRFAGTK